MKGGKRSAQLLGPLLMLIGGLGGAIFAKAPASRAFAAALAVGAVVILVLIKKGNDKTSGRHSTKRRS